MAVVVVGGQARKVGKTSLVCGLITALPERRWTAIKLTQHEPFEPVAGLLPSILIREERDRNSATDSSRYLAAGAERAFWIRVRPGHLGKQMPRIRELISGAQNTILESNSILEFLSPELVLFVLDPAIPEMKPSARDWLHRTDAFILPEGATSQKATAGERVFRIRPPQYASAELATFIAARLDAT